MQSQWSPLGSHPGVTVWFTGLPSSGKTTLSSAVARRLEQTGLRVEVIDSDVVREKLSADLDFSRPAREENMRRLAFAAELLTRNGFVALVAAISPYRAIREEIRKNSSNFLEVYVNAPLEICERRDVKGLYRRARNGEIRDFTGVDDIYEPPHHAEIECRTDIESLEICVEKVVARIITQAQLAHAQVTGSYSQAG
jgi:adenylylsulfate kinase